MPLITSITGLGLIILGLVAYVGTGMTHPTALIPTGFGVLYAILGILGGTESIRKHAMHAAAALSLVGFVLVGGKIAYSIKDFNIVETKGFTQFLMAVFCLVHLALCINSFVQARIAQAGKPGEPTPAAPSV
jgi:uncharacterized membrane protein AbrB (regulator of aidB expression)